MPEFRTPVMTLVEASWQDQRGALQTVHARMEDKSSGGACIRVKTPIGVGSKLRIQWRFEQFSGTARYCRSEGREYIVGIQRDTTKSSIPNQPAPMGVPPLEDVSSSDLPLPTVKTPTLPARQESKSNEIPIAEPKVESAPMVPTATNAVAGPPSGVVYEMDERDRLLISEIQEFDVLQRTQFQTKSLSKGRESGKERKHMRPKWLELPWHDKQERLSLGGAGNGEASDDGNSNGKSEKEKYMPHLTQPREKAPVHSAREVPNFQVELLPMEDIYRAAGIMNPRRGYSINKVVDMLHSEHICGLSKEMKRAALLMALDAAGMLINQVQQDAKARLDALDAYEAEQRKQIEAEWARKAEEVIQIQAELESIKAHYMARIGRNLEGVAREKATFNSWLTLKQQECQSMAEAVELCLKSAVSPSPSPSDVGMVKAAQAAGVGAKPA